MKMYVPDINEIWDEILSEKMIKKNRQYGNSVYDEDTIFSGIGDPEELIKIRLDDKMRRLKTLDTESDKYDSELMEIVAYLMHLLNWRRNSEKYKDVKPIIFDEQDEELCKLFREEYNDTHRKCRCETGDLNGCEEKIELKELGQFKLASGRDYRQPGEEEQSPEDPRESLKRRLHELSVWGLPDK